MTLGKAVAIKTEQLLIEHKITLNKLATIAGITQSTLDNIMKENSKNPKLKTIILIANAFGLTLSEFFNSNLFNFSILDIN